MGTVAFWVLSAVAVVSAVFTVTRKNPLSAAFSLVVCLVAIAGLFATLSAHFLFVIQLLVYAGAVMVLVIYVIMVLNLEEREMRVLGLSKVRTVLAVVAAVPAAAVLAKVTLARGAGAGAAGGSPKFGTVRNVAEALFTRYLFPFEVVSVLLLAAMVGAVVLALRRF